MKLFYRYCIIVLALLAINTARSQNIYSFSGSGKAGNLNFTFYNPTLVGSKKFTTNTVSSGPVQLFADTSAVFDTSLATYDLDSIPDQFVLYNIPCRFYLTSVALAKAHKTIKGSGYLITNGKPLGQVQINRLNMFSYKANADTLDFYVQFAIYSTAGDTVKSKASVHFIVVPHGEPDIAVFGVGGQRQLPSPTDPEFTVQSIDTSKKVSSFNFQAVKLRTVNYSGIDVTLENNSDKNKLYLLNNAPNVDTLNIYAETLTIKDGFRFPGTTINIYAKELRFEDVNGKSAYISTTPLSPVIPRTSGERGDKGQKGGDIHLHILTFTSNPGKRFILNGGDGEDVTTPLADSVMGEGGDGGNIYSTVDVSSYVVNEGGYSGNKRFDKFGRVQYKGKAGLTIADNNYATWLHPNYLHIVFNYYKDGFYAGITDAVVQSLSVYANAIDAYTSNGAINKIEDKCLLQVNQVRDDIAQVFYNITNGLDYYSNSPGWVPMLSFEVTKAAYTDEVNHALNVLFLDDIIRNAGNNFTLRQNAMQQMRDEAQTLVNDNKTKYLDLAENIIPGIKQQILTNNDKIEELKQELAALDAELNRLAKKKYNERKTWKWVGIASTILKAIPTPFTEAAGAALKLGTEFFANDDQKAGFKQGDAIGGKITAVLQPFTSGSVLTEVSSLGSNIATGVEKIFGEIGDIGSISDVINIGKEASDLYKTNKKVFDNVSKEVQSTVDLYNSITRVDGGELSKIKGELMANEPRLAAIEEEIKNLQDEQVKLANNLQAATAEMLTTKNNVYSGLTTISQFNFGIFSNASKYDHGLSVLSNDMRRRAFERLRKYHYYLLKAYEYRTLDTSLAGLWTLNSTAIVNRVHDFVLAGKTELTTADYAALKTIYDDEIHKIAEKIYDYYQSNQPAASQTAKLRLTKDEITDLNKGNAITINLVDKGIFPPDEDDIRLINLHVSKTVLKPVINANSGFYDQLDFKFDYPNYSKIRKSGLFYGFNNYNLHTEQPIRWGTRYDLYSQSLTDNTTSNAARSLLSTLFEGTRGAANVELYARPSAWADIKLQMNHTTDGASIVNLDSLFIDVQYDFQYRPNNIVNVELNTNYKWFAPTFVLSKPDKFQRKDGSGNIYRAYALSPSTSITATTLLKYGRFNFKRWTNRSGFPLVQGNGIDITGGNVLKFTLANDRSFKAEYQFEGAILTLPDTIYVNDSAEYPLRLKNEVAGQLLWSIGTVTDNWIHSSASKGINDTTIKLHFDTNPSDVSPRVGILDIVSTETELFHHYVYVVEAKGSGIYIKSFSPNKGRTGTSIKITGASFTNATSVKFGGVSTKFTKVNDTLITAVIGNGASGIVTVTAPKGKAQKDGFTYYVDTTSSILISALPGTTVCSGTPVTFTATATNGGNTPVYQWKKNNTTVGTNSGTYKDSLLKNGDSVFCVLTVSGKTFNSNTLKFVVKASVALSVSITDSAGTTICTGTNVKFVAKTLSDTAGSIYQWQKNGLSVGTNSNIYTDNLLKNGDSVKVTLTSAATCLISKTAVSNTLKFTVQTGKPATPTLISGPSTVTNRQTNIGFKTNYVPGITYIWSVAPGDTIKAGQGSDSITVNWGVNKIGTISVKASNMCGTSASINKTVTLAPNLVIQKFGIEATAPKILLYPNPAISEVKMELTGFNTGILVTITDMAGKIVWQQNKLTNGTYTIPISRYATGIYVVTARSSKSILFEKLVKAR